MVAASDNKIVKQAPRPKENVMSCHIVSRFRDRVLKLLKVTANSGTASINVVPRKKLAMRSTFAIRRQQVS